jgi:hypothetical protein
MIMLEWLVGDWAGDIQAERAARALYGDAAYESIKRHESEVRAHNAMLAKTAADRVDDVAAQVDSGYQNTWYPRSL